MFHLKEFCLSCWSEVGDTCVVPRTHVLGSFTTNRVYLKHLYLAMSLFSGNFFLAISNECTRKRQSHVGASKFIVDCHIDYWNREQCISY